MRRYAVPCLLVLLAAPASAGEKVVKDLRKLEVCELDVLFKAGETVPLCGTFDGAVLTRCPALCPRLAGARQSMAWKGKVFCADGTMTNRWALGIEKISVGSGPGVSRLDGGACWEVCYPEKTPIFGGTRDEIRKVAPGVYLGRVTTLCGEYRGYFVLYRCE